MLIGSLADRCASCDAPLASDQRYCIQCGERRGQRRFSTTTMTAQPAPESQRVVQTSAVPPRRRVSGGGTLIAGIATLLLAMGVGVEIGGIGQTGNRGGTRAAAPTVITVNGGGGSGAATTAAAAQPPTGKRPHVTKTEVKKAQQAAAAPKPTKKAVQKASQAASSVLGAGAGQQNSTVTAGQSCKAGSAGCQGGSFTGNFFGQ